MSRCEPPDNESGGEDGYAGGFAHDRFYPPGPIRGLTPVHNRLVPSPTEKLQERVQTQKKEPELYQVVLLNDDYTTMEFVVEVLESVFEKGPAEAFQIMMHVHRNGRGIAGVYPWEVAETKVETVTSLAREAGFPLKAVTEKV